MGCASSKDVSEVDNKKNTVKNEQVVKPSQNNNQENSVKEVSDQTKSKNEEAKNSTTKEIPQQGMLSFL